MNIREEQKRIARNEAASRYYYKNKDNPRVQKQRKEALDRYRAKNETSYAKLKQEVKLLKWEVEYLRKVLKGELELGDYKL